MRQTSNKNMTKMIPSRSSVFNNGSSTLSARQSTESGVSDDDHNHSSDLEEFVEKIKESLPQYFPSLDFQKYLLTDPEGFVAGQPNSYNFFVATSINNRKVHHLHIFRSVDRKDVSTVIRIGKYYLKLHSNTPLCCAILCQDIAAEALTRATKSNIRLVVTNSN